MVCWSAVYLASHNVSRHRSCLFDNEDYFGMGVGETLSGWKSSLSSRSYFCRRLEF